MYHHILGFMHEFNKDDKEMRFFDDKYKNELKTHVGENLKKITLTIFTKILFEEGKKLKSILLADMKNLLDTYSLDSTEFEVIQEDEIESKISIKLGYTAFNTQATSQEGLRETLISSREQSTAYLTGGGVLAIGSIQKASIQGQVQSLIANSGQLIGSSLKAKPLLLLKPSMTAGSSGIGALSTNTVGTSVLGAKAVGVTALGSKSIGVTALGAKTLGITTLGAKTIGTGVIGSKVLGAGALGAKAIGTGALGAKVIGAGTGAVGVGTGAVGVGTGVTLGATLLPFAIVLAVYALPEILKVGRTIIWTRRSIVDAAAEALWEHLQTEETRDATIAALMAIFSDL